MNARTSVRVSPRVVLGGMVVLVGVLLTLDQAEVIDVRGFWQLWPLLLVGFGLSKLLGTRFASERIWGGVILIAGVLLCLENLTGLEVPWRLIWPLALVALGVMIISRGIGRGRGLPASSGSWFREWAVFGGGERRIVSKNFEGGEANAIFGGLDLDLREAVLEAERADLDVFVAFGGLDIRVPEDWQVVVEAVSIFGGIDDKTRPLPGKAATPAKDLVIKGTVVFGGVDIKN